jgi:regulator of cell morphogenesis and NO signaling
MKNNDEICNIYECGLVRDLVLKNPQYREALEKLGIDTCCGGGQPLKEAMCRANTTFEALEKELQKDTPATTAVPGVDWQRASNELLIEYILQMHHATLREELPRLNMFFKRAIAAHSDHAEELKKMHTDFSTLHAALIPHLDLEEKEIFPAMRKNEIPKDAAKRIRQLEDEHTIAGNLLRKLNTATTGYRVPEYACPTVKMLFQGMAKLDAGLHEHIHLENNILFPRALR